MRDRLLMLLVVLLTTVITIILLAYGLAAIRKQPLGMWL